MLNFFENNRKTIILVILTFIILGFFLPRMVLSIATIAIFAQALISKTLWQDVKSYFQKPTFWAFIAIFDLYLIGGLWSEDLNYFFVKMTDKLAFAAISFGLLSLIKFDKKFTQKIYLLFVAILFSTGIYTFGDFIINYDLRTVNTNIARYTFSPTNHIIYSLLIANAIFIILFFLREKIVLQSKFLKASSIFLLLFFIFLLHFNAARTGIIAFYVCLFIFALKFILQQKKVILGIGLMLFLFAIPTFAYFTIDTFKNKIHYTLWDLKQTENTKVIKNYSDSKRIIGYKIAKDAFLEKPLFGYGTGDVKNALQKFTDKTYDKKIDVGELFASNQFLYFALALGIFGLLAFVFLLTKIYPLQLLLKNDLLLSAGIINFVALLPENILEMQYGIMVFCIFTVLAHCYCFQKETGKIV